MYSMEIPHKEYYYKNYKIIWFWDENNYDASKGLMNNVSILDENNIEIWNMRAVQPYDDWCTGLTVNEVSFYMYTFSGFGLTVSLNTLELLDKKLAK